MSSCLVPTRVSAGRPLPAMRLSHSASVPYACHYSGHPADTPGRSGPREAQRTKQTPIRSSSSQADSAGSIPVTRSIHEKRGNRITFDDWGSRRIRVFGPRTGHLGPHSHLGTHPSVSERDAQLFGLLPPPWPYDPPTGQLPRQPGPRQVRHRVRLRTWHLPVGDWRRATVRSRPHDRAQSGY
jgi:hypothetical protein